MSGGEIALLNLVRHLDRTIVEPIVLLGEDGLLIEKLRPCAEVYLLPLGAEVGRTRKGSLGAASLLRVASLWHAARYVIRLKKFILLHCIDLVHTNSLKADVLGGLAARLNRTPLIWHIRDRIAEDYLPRKVVRVFQFLCRAIPDVLIANSKATAATLAIPASARNAVCVVHDGTEVEPTQSQTQPRDPNGMVIGLIGRISPWKGQEVFLRAAAAVHRDHPAATFRIIGSALFDELEFEASMHKLRTELRLDRTVEFRGFREDIGAELAQLNILVHASTIAEPFGQVIIEGMAAGVPVVATNGGGVPEIVDDGITGLLVPMNDHSAMAAAIDALLRDSASAQAMGERGRVEVRRRFSIQKTAREIEQIYTLLLSGQPTS